MSAASIPRVNLPYNDDEEAERARAAAILSAGAPTASHTPLDGRDEAPLDESGKDAVSAKRSKRKTKKVFIAAVAFFLLLLLILVGAVFALRAMRGGNKNPTLKVGAAEEKKGGGFSDNLSGDEKLNAALSVLSQKTPPSDGGGAGAGSNQAAATGGDAITNTNLNTVAVDKSQHDGLPNLRSETVPDANGDTRQPGGGDVRGADESAGARAQSPPSGASANGSQSADGGARALAQKDAGGVMMARSVLHSPRQDTAP